MSNKNEFKFKSDIESLMVAEKEALIADLEAYEKSLIDKTITGKREVE